MNLRPQKIRKHGKVRWLLDLRSLGQGRQFFKTKSAAAIVAEQKSIEVTNHGNAAFQLTHEDRLQFMEAKRRLAAVNASIGQVTTFFLANHKSDQPRTLRAAIDEMVASKVAAGRSKRYTAQIKYTLDSLASAVGAEMLCSELDTPSVERWLYNADWSPRTRRGYLIDVRTFTKFCLRRGYMRIDPTTPIESIVVPKKAPGILKVAECVALMESARARDPDLVPYLAVALFCGVRRAEIARLTWRDIDIERGIIRIETHVAKTKGRRLVEISENAKKWLALGGKFPPINLPRRLNRARLDAKIHWPSDCLRHSFCSYHLATHESADKTALQAGHSARILFEHYRELVSKEDAARFWTIEPESQSGKILMLPRHSSG